MKKNFFKPEDFSPIMSNEGLACAANTKLQKLIESWPLVYGTKDNNGQHFHENPNGNYNPTLKARIAFIEEIKKDCKHEPFNDSCVPNHFHCKHCGVELQATWSEKK